MGLYPCSFDAVIYIIYTTEREKFKKTLKWLSDPGLNSNIVNLGA